jgi:hypothetical protein
LTERPSTHASIPGPTHPFRKTVPKDSNPRIHSERLFRKTTRKTRTHASIPGPTHPFRKTVPKDSNPRIHELSSTTAVTGYFPKAGLRR